jgi:hypothetical protein
MNQVMALHDLLSLVLSSARCHARASMSIGEAALYAYQQRGGADPFAPWSGLYF